MALAELGTNTTDQDLAAIFFRDVGKDNTTLPSEVTPLPETAPELPPINWSPEGAQGYQLSDEHSGRFTKKAYQKRWLDDIWSQFQPHLNQAQGKLEAALSVSGLTTDSPFRKLVESSFRARQFAQDVKLFIDCPHIFPPSWRDRYREICQARNIDPTRDYIGVHNAVQTLFKEFRQASKPISPARQFQAANPLTNGQLDHQLILDVVEKKLIATKLQGHSTNAIVEKLAINPESPSGQYLLLLLKNTETIRKHKSTIQVEVNLNQSQAPQITNGSPMIYDEVTRFQPGHPDNSTSAELTHIENIAEFITNPQEYGVFGRAYGQELFAHHPNQINPDELRALAEKYYTLYAEAQAHPDKATTQSTNWLLDPNMWRDAATIATSPLASLGPVHCAYYLNLCQQRGIDRTKVPEDALQAAFYTLKLFREEQIQAQLSNHAPNQYSTNHPSLHTQNIQAIGSPGRILSKYELRPNSILPLPHNHSEIEEESLVNRFRSTFALPLLAALEKITNSDLNYDKRKQIETAIWILLLTTLPLIASVTTQIMVEMQRKSALD
jgi:hypothetical protein